MPVMSKLRVAVLEDEPTMLKELVARLRRSEAVDVVAFARDRISFISEVAAQRPEALVLDIDLVGEPEGGLAVAKELALPVLFFSGHVGRNLEAIEVLDAVRSRLPVAHLTKTCADEVFLNRLRKFVEQVRAWRKHQRVALRPKNKGSTIEVEFDEIVAITVDRGSATHNNKCVLFKERKPIVLAKVSLVHLPNIGFTEEVFEQISSDWVVNRFNALEWTRSAVKIRYMKTEGAMATEVLPIKEAFRKGRG